MFLGGSQKHAVEAVTEGARWVLKASVFIKVGLPEKVNAVDEAEMWLDTFRFYRRNHGLGRSPRRASGWADMALTNRRRRQQGLEPFCD